MAARNPTVSDPALGSAAISGMVPPISATTPGTFPNARRRSSTERSSTFEGSYWTSTIIARPSWDVSAGFHGFSTNATPRRVRALERAASIASRRAGVSIGPSWETSTTSAVAARRSGNALRSNSVACWESDPGTDTPSVRSPCHTTNAAITTTLTASARTRSSTGWSTLNRARRSRRVGSWGCNGTRSGCP